MMKQLAIALVTAVSVWSATVIFRSNTDGSVTAIVDGVEHATREVIVTNSDPNPLYGTFTNAAAILARYGMSATNTVDEIQAAISAADPDGSNGQAQKDSLHLLAWLALGKLKLGPDGLVIPQTATNITLTSTREILP